MNRRGFTLIEVLTTITIIGILVAITSVVYSSSLKRSRDGQRKTDIDTIKNALEQYYLDNHRYPSYNQPPGKEKIYNARWQFESGQVSSCSSNRAALSPLILTTVPEDPTNKLPISVASCDDLRKGNLSGEYLYFVGGSTTPRNADPRPTAGYYLVAKMETVPKVNLNNNACSDTASLRYIRSLLGDGSPCNNPNILHWGYDLDGLVFGNGIGSGVTHNYKVNSVPNN